MDHPSAPASQPLPGYRTGTPGAAGNPPPRRPEVHLLDHLAVVYRYRYVAATVFALASAALILQSYSNLRFYQAQARLLIEDERSTAIPGLTTTESYYWEDPEPYRQTQYRILKGRELTRRVVRRLELGKVPEFNGTAAQPATLGALIRRGLASLRPEPESNEPRQVDELDEEAALVDAFISRVIVEPVAGSKLVDVYFRSTEPALAAQAANTLVEEYVAQNIEAKLQGTSGLLEWLDQELVTQQKKVEDSERAMAEYRARENAMSLDERNNIVASQLNALNEALLRAQTTRIERGAVLEQVRDQSSSSTPPDAIPAIAQNPQVQSARAHLADLQRQKAQLSERYGEKHPAIIEVNASLADAQRQLTLETNKALQTVRNEYQRAVLEERTIRQNLESAKADVQDLNRKSVSYSVLQREAESNRTVYETLLQRANELRVSTNSRTNNVRIVDRAEVPQAPSTPSSRRTWLLSILVGLVAAVAVAYGLDYMNDTIKTPEDIGLHLRVPFLGLVPSVREDNDPILASSNTPHVFGEAFRSLRTAITAQYPGTGTKTMVVTSAQPLEGKTTTACNIAMALAYGGTRVLLIDADMRRPGVHRPLRLTNTRGLSHVLAGEARVRDVIQRSIDPNLLVITAGGTPANAAELLASERMKMLLSNLSQGPFDWIIIDTPPVLAVTDAVILAPATSGVTFVIGAEMTRRRLAARAVETLLANRPQILGAVLNRVDFDRNRYYYSRYHGHQYKSYYAAAS